MKDRHSIDVHDAARLARDDEPRPDTDQPTWAEAERDREPPPAARPRRWVIDNGFAWEAVYPENER